jgi:hypothetical protein
VTPGTPAPPLDLVVGGAQKAGTSTLLGLIGHADGVTTHTAAEFPYFVDEDWFRLGYAAAFERAYGPVPRTGPLVAKCAGLMYVPDAPDRLRQVSPDARVVVVLREPVARAYSAYWFCRRVGRESAATFERALRAEDERRRRGTPGDHLCDYVGRGRYAHQVERLWAVFGPERVHVVLFEDLVADPVGTTSTVLDWAGLPRVRAGAAMDTEARNVAARPRSARLSRTLHRPPPAVRRAVTRLSPEVRNRLRRRVIAANEAVWVPPAMEPSTRQRLRETFAPDRIALEGLLGRDLRAWS